MRRVRPTFFAAACLLAASGTAWGRQDANAPQPQDDGPVIVGAKRGKYTPLEFRSITAGFEFLGQYHKEKQKQSDGTTLEDRETRLRETLNLEWDASIGHKNLIDFSGGAKLGVESIDTRSDTEGVNSKDNELVDMYDLRALILGESELPVTLYTKRDQSQSDREFAGTIESTTSESGAIAQLRSKVAPTTLQIFHREEDQSDPLGTTDYNLTQDTAHLESNVVLTDAQRLEVDYTFDSVDEKQGSLFQDTYDRNDGTFTHLLDFGPDKRDNLRSSFRVYTQTGLVAQETYRLDEQLRLYHSDRLDSHYDATLEDRTIQGQEQKLVRGLAGIRHRLFDSLTSTASIGGTREEITDISTSDTVFVTGGLDYTKKVPWGRLDASLGLSFQTQDNSDRGTSVAIQNESHTFNDPFPIVISRRNIVPSSVRVTAASGFPEYQEGSDYTLDAFSNRIELRRVVGGAIADGETVLVSYEVGPEPGNTLDTNTQTVTLRYTIDEGWLTGLSPYLIYRRTDESVSTKDPSQFILDDVNSLTYGLDYRLGGLFLKAEEENHDSTVQPYDATRLEASYNQRFSRDSALNLSATQEMIDYRDETSSVTLNRLSGRWTQRFEPSLELSVDLVYRDEQDGDGTSTQGFEQGLEIRWRKRQTSVYLTLRNSMLDGDSVNNSSQALVFGFRRDF